MISSTTDISAYISFLCAFLVCCFYCSAAIDNITTGNSISDGLDYLESPGQKFQMGFFPRDNTSKPRYIGIWYTMDPNTVVWVANRDRPLPDFTGVLTISVDGVLRLVDKDQKAYFYTRTGGSYLKTLKLLDSGNAILIDLASGSTVWQSFLNPTDTFLPGMKMDVNLKLTSWKTEEDPSPGPFTFGQDLETKQYVIMNRSTIYHWKSGSGSKSSFDPDELFTEVYYLLSNSSERTNILTYNNKTRPDPKSLVINDYSRLLMNYSGKIQYFSWAETEKQWVLDWQEPGDGCSIYGVCGKFGLCSLINGARTCTCSHGFEPNSPDDYAAGCKRIAAICVKNDTFTKVSISKVENPTVPFFNSMNNESECRNRCLEFCQCQAYSYTGGVKGATRCWIWESELNNLRSDGRLSIFIRVSGSTEAIVNLNPAEGSPPNNSSSVFLTGTHMLIFAMIILVISLLCSIGYIYYKRQVTREEGRNSIHEMNDSERRVKDLLDLQQSRDEDIEGIEVPFFQFQSILAATDNFSDTNKLGQGGFGPVYKGKLPGGPEIAVKRLSSLSGQGLEEFRNEVILISKLQHRNLVRLVGYCVKGNEKILLYEYMRNKSLDCFIFDRTPSISLDWAKRYEIIMGIARGLLYLHQDSRLRIIHRDLKTSNILLDEELNPKISDFGLAKIVQGKEMESSTNRVIGTYGYMAPEYALDGFFSIKSDVFSFGVVLLEIISGKRNTGSYQSQQTPSLLGCAWNLWKEDIPFELMDQQLVESSNSSEVLKCIIVGLLCVQEDPGDRPTMTNVVLMLGGDIASLPAPKQPAFVPRKTMSSSSSSSYKPDQTQTNNTLTITLQEGR